MVRLCVRRHALDGSEEPVQKTTRARDAAVPEIAALLVRTKEHQVGAKRVGTPLLDVRVGVHNVALRLRHLRAFADDVTVRPELYERLLEVEDLRIVENHP